MRARTILPWIVLLMGFALVATARSEESLDDLLAPGVQATVLGTGYGFSEGPAADTAGNVYFSDGKNNTIHVYRPGKGVEVFVDDSLDANGMMFNRAGQLVVCEGAAFRVVAFDVRTKKKQVLIGGEPRRFNEPNDLAIDSTGGFYFTDPNYRHRGQQRLKKEDVYYVASDGTVTRVSDVCIKPNGILLTPDEKTLYLADCSGKVIYKYRVLGPGRLANQTKWLELDGHPDGMTLDAKGNLYIACGRNGVVIYSPQGKRIGTIGPERGVPYASNCCFGGPDFRTLLITSRDKFLGIPMKVQGVKPLPARN